MDPQFHESAPGDAALRQHRGPGRQRDRLLAEYKLAAIDCYRSTVLSAKCREDSAPIQPKGQGQRAFKTDAMSIYAEIAQLQLL